MGVRNEGQHMSSTDAYKHGSEDTRHDFAANDCRISRKIVRLSTSAEAIKCNEVASGRVSARVLTAQHLAEQVGHPL
jgi:hypothetical protein